jgi:putative oxidoreductase
MAPGSKWRSSAEKSKSAAKSFRNYYDLITSYYHAQAHMPNPAQLLFAGASVHSRHLRAEQLSMNDTRELSEQGHNSPFAFRNRTSLARWAPIPLRLIVGYGFMQHGFAKLSKGPEAFAIILHAIGVPAPHLMAWLTILIEIFGGLAVLLGAFIPLVSLPMAGILLVAMFVVHWPYGFSSIKIMSVVSRRAQFGPPGYECDLLYLACLAALVLAGSGPMAIDGHRRRRSQLRFSCECQ